MIYAIPFPPISPDAFTIPIGDGFAVKWYALSYVVGIAIGWWMVNRALVTPRLWAGEPPMSRDRFDDLATWIILGIVLGGRLGFTLLYEPGYYLAHPLEIITGIRTGGMSFHGGFLGVVTAIAVFTWRHKVSTASTADLLALASPPALGIVRVANFVNAELWGRPTEAPWGVIFPGEAAQSCATATAPCARHPSQLYEAGLEGLLLTLVLLIAVYGFKSFRRPGLTAGIFFLGYGVARFFVEFFRLADAQYITPDNPFGHVFLGMTMGQLLSTPMILAGIGTILWALRRK